MGHHGILAVVWRVAACAGPVLVRHSKSNQSFDSRRNAAVLTLAASHEFELIQNGARAIRTATTLKQMTIEGQPASRGVRLLMPHQTPPDQSETSSGGPIKAPMVKGT